MKFHHVAITVKDLNTAISFYNKFFGFTEVKRFRRDDLGGTGVFLQGENAMLELWQFDSLKEGVKEDLFFTGIKHIAFTNDDLESVRNNLVANGIACGEITKGASGGIYFFLSDPDGNQIEIYKNNDLGFEN